MSKAQRKIAEGLKRMVAHDMEIMTGVVQSVDTDSNTMSVLLTNDEDAIEGVLLTAISGTNAGVIPIPAVNSNVVVCTLDGGGEWMLLKASAIDKWVVTIGNMVLTMDGDKYGITIGTESLLKILNDLTAKIALMTFTNGAGTTSFPNNVTDINAINTRINNFLS